MAQRSADQSSIGGHLGDARSEVVAMLVAVLGQPRGEKLLSSGEGTGREHLGAQRVRFKLLDVGLKIAASQPLAKPNFNIGHQYVVLHFPSSFLAFILRAQ